MDANRPFTFLDHAFRCGDSLLGVSSVQQVEYFSIRPGEQQITFATANLIRSVEDASDKRCKLESMPSNDRDQVEAKSRLLAEADNATAKVKVLADCLIALEIDDIDGKLYDERRTVAAENADAAMGKSLAEFQAYAREQLRARRTLHWPIEFPEVFARGGFDAFVGNPPFLGGAKLETALGTDYRAHIVRFIANGITGTRGTADLATYFLLRAELLTRKGGILGLVVTNSLGQGDARDVGLSQVLKRGHTIIRSVPSSRWPGEATVFFAMVWIFAGEWRGDYCVDGDKVAFIDASMNAADASSIGPFKLTANQGLAFEGAKLSGEGFVVPNRIAISILDRSPEYSRVLRPYLTGALVNGQPKLIPAEYVITFYDWPLSRQSAPAGYVGPVTGDFPECLEWVELHVRPQRHKLPPTTPWNRKLREFWWHFGQWRWALDDALAKVDKVLVLSRVSPYVMVDWVDKSWVFSDRLTVFATEQTAMFGLLQSSFHDIWSWRYGTTNLSLLSYSPAACFLTFPIPSELAELDRISGQYHEHRSLVKRTHGEGLTSTYNCFHDSEVHSEEIETLRKMHVQMDRAVAKAYGWSDLVLGHDFRTKQGIRYTMCEFARRAVLDRLLELNHRRRAEEEAAAVAIAGDRPSKRGRTKRRKSENLNLDLL
jgi:hypothetical protein